MDNKPKAPSILSQIANLKGTSREPVAVNTTLVQPPPEQVIDPIQVKEVKPEPAKTAADHIPPSQESLHLKTMQTDAISPRGAMVPSFERPSNEGIPTAMDVPLNGDNTPKVKGPEHFKSDIPVDNDNLKRHKFTEAEIKKAAEARAKREYDWETAPLSEALNYLATLRLEVEKGGRILEKRRSEQTLTHVKCFGCENIIDIGAGHYVTMRNRNNFETGQVESAYACSLKCAVVLNRDFRHVVRLPEPRAEGGVMA